MLIAKIVTIHGHNDAELTENLNEELQKLNMEGLKETLIHVVVGQEYEAGLITFIRPTQSII